MTTRRAFLAATACTALAQSWLPAGSLGAAGAPDVARSAAGRSSPNALLLVDEHHILYRSGTHRVFHPLKRHPGNPLIKGKDKPWEVAIAFNTVHRDAATGRYQMWYQTYAGPVARDKTRSCTVAYAESVDGITWTKPELELFDFNDTKRTNIVLIANGGKSDRYGASVIFDPRDPDLARRYKMAYFDFSYDGGHEYPGLSVAFSPDGIHWKKHPKAPLLRAAYGELGDVLPFQDEADTRPWSCPLALADATEAMLDPEHDVFAIYGKMWIDGPEAKMYGKHAACRTVSKDFINWERPSLVMTPDDQDPASVEFHTTPVFYHSGCFFAAPQILNRADRGGTMDVELALSRDGVHFTRPFRDTFWLPKSKGNQFDSGTVLTNATPVVLDDEIRFYYGGYSMGATGADDTKQISGIGLATMPRDRFAGVRPTEKIGQITLKPIDLAGCSSIHVNADASRGSVRVSLLDENGRRVRGYSEADATPLTGDSLRHTVAWKEKDLAHLPAGKYMLRLHLESAEIFALTLHTP